MAKSEEGRGVVHVRSPHGERLVWCKAVEKDLKWADNPEQGTCHACREKMAEGCPFGDYRGFCTHPDCKAHKPTEPPAVKVGQLWWLPGINGHVRPRKIEGDRVWLTRLGEHGFEYGASDPAEYLQREGRLVKDVWCDHKTLDGDHYCYLCGEPSSNPPDAEMDRLLKEAEERGYQRGLSDGASHAWEATAMYRGRLAGDLRATREAIRAEPAGEPPGYDSLTDDEGLL